MTQTAFLQREAEREVYGCTGRMSGGNKEWDRIGTDLKRGVIL